MRPCFSQAVFLKTKYWSHYSDIERKMFDELCTEHAKSFAKVCIHQYFKSVSGDMHTLHSQHRDNCKEDDNRQFKEDDKLLGIHAQDDINQVLWNWHMSKPPLSLRKNGVCDDANEKDSGSQNGEKTGYDNVTFTTDYPKNGCITCKNGKGFTNGNARMNQHTWNGYGHPSSIKKKEWAVYYSKV